MLSRKDLEGMRRADIQALCKEVGVRANLKTESLIDLLLETQSAPTTVNTTGRSVSKTRRSSQGTGRTASVVIHDVPQTAMDTIQEDPEIEADNSSRNEPSQQARTRKARDLQTRLGVGRPKAAGGSGARTVTKSTSVPRGRKGKSARSMASMDATILEETESSLSGPPRAQSERPVSQSTPFLLHERASSTPPSDISQHIADALRPLLLKVDNLEGELRKIRQQNQEFERIQSQLASVSTLQQRYDTLEAEVRELRRERTSIAALTEEFKQLKANLTSQTSPVAFPTTPQHKALGLPDAGENGLAFPSAFKSMGFHPSMDTSTPTDAIMRERPSDSQTPGPSSVILGKRPRSTSADHDRQYDQTESYHEQHPAVQPDKKRVKLDSSARLESQLPGPSKSRLPTAEIAAQLLGPRKPQFTVFQGHDAQVSTPHVHTTPPMNPLPEIYRPHSPPGAPLLPAARTGRVTSSAINTENQRHTLDLSLFDANDENESAPRPIPFPVAPPSPSPVGHNTGFMNQLDPGRSDIFRGFGLPSPRRPSRVASNSVEATQRKETTGNEVAAGLGQTMVRTGSPAVVESTPSRKTMYGTELEGDSRFGDFGVEGIGSGFWSMR